MSQKSISGRIVRSAAIVRDDEIVFAHVRIMSREQDADVTGDSRQDQSFHAKSLEHWI